LGSTDGEEGELLLTEPELVPVPVPLSGSRIPLPPGR
jgi:hypothetical protein